MSNMSKLFKLFSFVMVLCAMFILVGCESINGPEGKYFHIKNQKEAASVTFEDDKVTVVIDGETKGIFDYEYERDENDKVKGKVVIDSTEYPWVMEFNYEKKEIYFDFDGDGRLNVFIKSLA